MKSITKFLLLTCMTFVLIFSSCSSDQTDLNEEFKADETSAKPLHKSAFTKLDNPDRILWKRSGLVVDDFSIGTSILDAVEPSECGPTPFREVLTKYDDLLWYDFLSVYDGNIDAYYMVLGDYFVINQIAALDLGVNAEYFGDHGQYTSVVNKNTRNLESFWNMYDLVQVRGQHSSTLENLDVIRFVYENYSSASPEEIDYLVAIAEQYNNAGEQIPENPFYASDGFATTDAQGNGYIVIGDGLVKMLAEVGIDPKVVWSSILAHEWGHQIQFLNDGLFVYPVPPFINTPESTRMTELEADFYTGYYLTHKRGGTYNWKRVEAFLTAFFEIGDCSFASSGHHGTPIQRMQAAYQGYMLSRSEMKKGIISSPEDVHEAFVEKYEYILGSN